MNSSSRIRTNDQNVAFLEAKVDRLTNQLSKLENDRILSLQREVAMLRQLLDFQNAKLDKVTLLLTDLVTQLMHRKGKSGDDEVEMELRAQGAPPEVTEDDDESMLHSIRAFQDSVNVSDLQRHNLPLQINQNMNHLQTQQPRLIVQQSILDHNRVSMQRMQQQLTHHQNQTTVPDPLDRDLRIIWTPSCIIYQAWFPMSDKIRHLVKSNSSKHEAQEKPETTHLRNKSLEEEREKEVVQMRR